MLFQFGLHNRAVHIAFTLWSVVLLVFVSRSFAQTAQNSSGQAALGQPVQGVSDQADQGQVASSLAPLEQALSYHEQALMAMDADQEDLAFSLARKAKRLAPENTQVVFLMSLLLADRHRYPEAIRMLDQLSGKDTTIRLPAMGQTAEWLIKSGDWVAGEERYLALLQEAPEAALVHRGLASLYLRQGHDAKAAVHLRKLCELGDIQESELRSLLMQSVSFPGDATPDNFDPVGTLGLAKAQAAYADWKSAAETLQLDDPATLDELAFAARCAIEMQDWESLQRWIKSISENHPSSAIGHAGALYALGVYSQRQGNAKAAAGYLIKAIQLDATDLAAYRFLQQVAIALDASQVVEKINQRIAMISRTQELGAEMASGPDRSYGTMTELIELLAKLNRPLESLAWRGVRLAYGQQHGTLPSSQAREQLQQILSERESELQRTSAEKYIVEYRDFVVCGLSQYLQELSEE